MYASIGKRYEFSAAHYLTGVGADHPCAATHGHNYVVEVEVGGEIDTHTGFVVDFHDIDREIKPLIQQLDHTTVNYVIANPTAENIAAWFLANSELADMVTCWETPKCWAKVSR